MQFSQKKEEEVLNKAKKLNFNFLSSYIMTYDSYQPIILFKSYFKRRGGYRQNYNTPHTYT